MKVVVLKYNAGNVRSVLFALERIGVEAVLSDEAAVISSADRVIFPGVGEASSAMRYLGEKGLDKIIPQLRQPMLGICLGMQLMCRHSEEGNTDCLGIFNAAVRKFDGSLKVPQVGWNSVKLKGTDFRLAKNVGDGAYFYFVHSYYVEENTSGVGFTEYGIRYCSMMQKDNFYAVQFHPEKSGKAGEILLKNFLAL